MESYPGTGIMLTTPALAAVFMAAAAAAAVVRLDIHHQSEMCHILESVVDSARQEQFVSPSNRARMSREYLERALKAAGAYQETTQAYQDTTQMSQETTQMLQDSTQVAQETTQMLQDSTQLRRNTTQQVPQDTGQMYRDMCPINQQRRSCLSYYCGVRVADILPGWRCNCDAECEVYGDCCHDVHDNCPHVFTSKRDTPVTRADVTWTCEAEPTWNYQYNDNRGVFTVSACPAGWGSGGGEYSAEYRQYVSALCAADTTRYQFTGAQSVVLSVPVQDQITGRVYKNYYCGMCHGAALLEQQAHIWQVVMECPGNVPPPNSSLSDEQTLCYLTRAEHRCRGIMVPRGTGGHRRCQAHAVSDCASPDITPALLVDACDAYTNHVFTHGLLFKNVHCAMCNGVVLAEHQPYRLDRTVNVSTATTGGNFYIPEEMPAAQSWTYDLRLTRGTILNLHNMRC